MNKYITYNIEDKEFYSRAENYAKQAYDIVDSSLANIVKKYIDFIDTYSIERLRTKVEYELDIVNICVIYMCYYELSTNYSDDMINKLSKASLLRKNGIDKDINSNIKGYVLTRGINKIYDIYSEGNLFDNFVNTVSTKDELINKQEQFYNWLEATGEFYEESIRYKMWIDFLSDCEESPVIWNTVVKTVRELISYLDDKLSSYVDYLRTSRIKLLTIHEDKEDVLFISRLKEEYYINIIGSFWLNYAYKDLFVATSIKYIFLPGCMTAKNIIDCKAVKNKFGLSCVGCTSDCPVNKLRKSLEDTNVSIAIVHHESDLYRASFDEKNENVGIVGIACLLNLISGGLKARRLGFAPQCVLLNYCGCDNHWSKDRTVTNINLNRLMDLLLQN